MGGKGEVEATIAPGGGVEYFDDMHSLELATEELVVRNLKKILYF